MKEYQRQGMTAKQYREVHKWLLENFDKPELCEHCNQKKPLENALIHGKRYEKNRDHFICLCRKCHIDYDKPYMEIVIEKSVPVPEVFEQYPNLHSHLKRMHMVRNVGNNSEWNSFIESLSEAIINQPRQATLQDFINEYKQSLQKDTAA